MAILDRYVGEYRNRASGTIFAIREFQVDAQGKVTGAILEQQGPQGPQRISLQRT